MGCGVGYQAPLLADVGDLTDASVHRLGRYEDGKVRSGLWCLCCRDGSTAGTSVDSFTSVLTVASVPVTSQDHHNRICLSVVNHRPESYDSDGT